MISKLRGGDLVSFLILLLSMQNHILMVPVKTDEARQAKEDHSAVEIMNRKLPSDAIIISHTPSIWLNRNRASIQIKWALEHPLEMELIRKKFKLFYHLNYWDIVNGMSYEGREIINRYNLKREFAKVEAERNWVFKLLYEDSDGKDENGI